jgi:NAD(P)H-dependent FMN reductase
MSTSRTSFARVVRVVAIPGSLNGSSANHRLLVAVQAAAPPTIEVEIWNGVGRLPHFSPDVPDDLVSPAVNELRDEIRNTDVVLIATPEYAGGMPGSLKNAFDWLVGSGEFYGKPVVVVSAAPTTDRGQGARRWTEETLRMQGATINASLTVALRASDTGNRADAAAEQVLKLLT